MPKISNAKYTTNLPDFNKRGIPSTFIQFGSYQIANYSMVNRIRRSNIEQKRPKFQFIM